MKARKTRARAHYHHGALQEALVEATEAILAERSVEGFTLREAARRAGVSPAAPAHHFGSATGLLTEVAIRGFEELTRHLEEGNVRGGSDPSARLREQGIGYVRFALTYPGRFKLMFRRDLLQSDNARLQAAARAAYAALERAVRDVVGLDAECPVDRATLAAMIGAWSMVHGFAHLALDGRFNDMAGPGGLAAFVRDVLPDVLMAFSPARGRDVG